MRASCGPTEEPDIRDNKQCAGSSKPWCEHRVETGPKHSSGGNVEPGYPVCIACVFRSRLKTHIAGTVDIGLSISPEGDVAKNSRVLDGPALLVQSSMDAIREWKFRPNVVEGELTWSRVRALVHFNSDGTTAIDLAPAILADNFGDPGTPRSAAAL